MAGKRKKSKKLPPSFEEGKAKGKGLGLGKLKGLVKRPKEQVELGLEEELEIYEEEEQFEEED